MRPRAASVQRLRRGQSSHRRPKRAVPDPSVQRMIGTRYPHRRRPAPHHAQPALRPPTHPRARCRLRAAQPHPHRLPRHRPRPVLQRQTPPQHCMSFLTAPRVRESGLGRHCSASQHPLRPRIRLSYPYILFNPGSTQVRTPRDTPTASGGGCARGSPPSLPPLRKDVSHDSEYSVAQRGVRHQFLPRPGM
jgi:hypothetical protein